MRPEKDEIKENTTEFAESISLPVEVIIHIMRYLPLSDMKNARLVSRLWYEASQDFQLLQREVVVFSTDGISSNSPLPVLLSSEREFFHFTFKEGDINWKNPEFWNRFGPRLKSLCLFNCDVRERDFVDILSRCKNLESLRTSGCRELLMSGGLLRDSVDVNQLRKVLVNLKELCISYNSYLSDALFNRIVCIARNIEFLSLEGCQVSFHLGLYAKFYPKDAAHAPEELKGHGNGEVMDSTSILTFRNILRYITSRSVHISRLCFGHTFIDSPALTQLAKVPDLRLKSLFLSNCEQLTNAGVVALTEHQGTLEQLDLGLCSRVTDPSVLAICRSLNNLQDLSMRRCRAVSDIGVAEVHRLNNLISLDISQCDQVTSVGITRGLCSKLNTTLRRLYLSGINNMTQDTVVSLAQSLPNLTHLDLGYCFTAVTDVSVQAIFKHQVWLRSLKLTACDRVTDAGLTGMGMGTQAASQTPSVVTSEYLRPNAVLDDAPNYDHNKAPSFRISLRSRAEEEIVRDAERKKAVLQMCEDRLPTDKPTGYSLARLKGLRHLDLSGCTRITDVSLCYAFKFPELESLDLSRCCQVTQVGLETLALNNPSIETLILYQCFSITDKAVGVLSRKLCRLRHLDLHGCRKLTNDSLDALAQNCKSLRHLDMRRCDRLGQCRDGLLDHVLTLLLPIAVIDPDDQLPPPCAPPLPFK